MKKTAFTLLLTMMVGCSSGYSGSVKSHWYLSSSDSAGYQYMTYDSKSKGIVGFKCLSNNPTFAFYLSEKLGEETSPILINLSDGSRSMSLDGSLYVDSVRSGWAKVVSRDNESMLSLFNSEPYQVDVGVNGENGSVKLSISTLDFLDGYEIFSSLCSSEVVK